MEKEPIIIGISGGSCSGKTDLSQRLHKEFPDSSVLLPFDAYYECSLEPEDLDSMEEPKLYNFGRFVIDLAALKRGEPITFSYNSHELSGPLHPTTLDPKPIIICEGFLIFHEARTREIIDYKYYVDIPQEVMISRRLKRQEPNNHYNEEPYVTDKLIPAHHRLVLPQRRFADRVLDGTLTQEMVFQELLSSVQERGLKPTTKLHP